MSLLDFWKSNKEELSKKQVKQIVSLAGDGRLSDDSATSLELREFISIVPSQKLNDYASECLEDSFDFSGFVLQDIVNEVGKRFGFDVLDGRYRGKKGSLGQDGLWTLKNGRTILVEVKTTDAYAIDLDVIANYRKELIRQGNIQSEDSSILIVVGRKDTGALEAQIRGSRFAWDIRIISIEALLKLLRVKQNLDDPSTVSRISEILIPKEYTRIDEIIDLVFETAEEVASTEPVDDEDEEWESDNDEAPVKKVPKFTPVGFHDKCADRIEKHLGLSLVKEGRTLYRDATTSRRILIVVSKQHKNNNYWFAFHPHQRDVLAESANSLVALGCGSEENIFLLPIGIVTAHLDDTWITQREDRMYWHIRIEPRNGSFYWNLRRGIDNLPINEYRLT